MGGVERQPQFATGKACTDCICMPRERRAAAIASLVQGPVRLAERILQVSELDFTLRQAQFFALIEEDRAAQCGEQGQMQFWRRCTPIRDGSKRRCAAEGE
jgi:hypothetical protein